MSRLTDKRLKVACDYFVHFASKEEAVKYRMLAESAPKYEEIYRKLADYEDKQEQGLLIELPVAIGTEVYFTPSEKMYELNLICNKKGNRVYYQKVKRITIGQNGWYLECDKDVEYGTGKILLPSGYKKTWFLTRSEAEEALAKMGGKA